MPSPLERTPTCTGVPPGVCRAGVHQQVLDDPFHLGGVDVRKQLLAVDPHGMRVHPGGLARDAAHHLADVRGLALGLHLPAVQPFEIEHVVDQAVHLASALLDHLIQALDLVVGQLQLVAATERRHGADDTGERPLEIVRHGVEQRVLHVVHLAQPARHLVFALDALDAGLSRFPSVWRAAPRTR